MQNCDVISSASEGMSVSSGLGLARQEHQERPGGTQKDKAMYPSTWSLRPADEPSWGGRFGNKPEASLTGPGGSLLTTGLGLCDALLHLFIFSILFILDV